MLKAVIYAVWFRVAILALLKSAPMRADAKITRLNGRRTAEWFCRFDVALARRRIFGVYCDLAAVLLATEYNFMILAAFWSPTPKFSNLFSVIVLSFARRLSDRL